MIGTINRLYIRQYLNPLFADKLQFSLATCFVMLELDFQTFLIIDAIFIEMFDLFYVFDEQLFGFDTLSFAGLDASGTVDYGFGSAVLIEIF